MNPLQMEDMIRKICNDNNIKCKIKIMWSGRLAFYRYKENTIYFNPDRFIPMANKMNLSLDKFITFTTYHEIGHYLDYSSGTLSNEIIEREVAAWKLTRELINQELVEEYDKFNEINLESYRKKLKI